MGSENSGLRDIFEVIREAYLRADPKVSIYDLDIPRRYIEVLERWIFIDKMRSINYPKKKTSEIQRVYMRKFGKSAANFYVDKKHCERLFGELAVIDKEYEKKIASENYNALFTLALSRGDVKSAIEALKQRSILLGLYDKDSVDMDRVIGDRSFVMNTTIVLDGNKIEERRIDISKLQDLSIKDLKSLGEMIDTPEVDVNLMSKMIDETNDGDE